MPSERVHGAVIVPAPVDVAGAPLVPPDVPELGVEHRLAPLLVAGLEVEWGVAERAVADAADVRLPLPTGQVVMPRAQIGFRVSSTTTDGVVLDEPRGVQCCLLYTSDAADERSS